MKKLALCLAAAALIATGCNKNNGEQPLIGGVTLENYPRVDGSTTTIGLQHLIACKLLGYDWEWADRSNDWGEGAGLEGAYAIGPANTVSADYWSKVKSSKTHGSFVGLIDGTVDFSITARTMSPGEKELAASRNVAITETSIARDAFVFITHPDNPISALTTQQIRDIYTGSITNWKEVGGLDAPIHPFRRPKDSGSQELMDELVMKDRQMIDIPEEHNMFSMMGVYHALKDDPQGLCYTVYYYHRFMVRDKLAKLIAVDGVMPTDATVRNQSYPYTTAVYSVIRSDLPAASLAHKIYDLLLTPAGRHLIAESGYVVD